MRQPFLLVLAAAITLGGCQVKAGLPGIDVSPGASGSTSSSDDVGDDDDVGCDGELGTEAPEDLDDALAVDDAPIRGCIGNGDEIDVYEFTAPDEPSGVLVRVQGKTTTGWLYVEFYDADHQLYGQLHLQERESGQLWANVAGGTKYYLLVKGYEGGEAHTYRLRFKVAPIDDPAEPNDERRSAAALELGQSVRAMATPLVNAEEVDLDWFQVKIRRRGELNLVVDKVPDDVSLKLALYDADGRDLRSDSSANPGAVVRLAHPIKRPGTYYVRVDSGYTRRWATGKPRRHATRQYRLRADME